MTLGGISGSFMFLVPGFPVESNGVDLRQFWGVALAKGSSGIAVYARTEIGDGKVFTRLYTGQSLLAAIGEPERCAWNGTNLLD